MIIATSFKRFHACIAVLSAPTPPAGHLRPVPLPETPEHSRACLGQSLVGSRLLSPGFHSAQGSVCALHESVSPVLCKSWWLCGAVNSDLLQEDFMPYQGPCPCSSLLLTYLCRRHSNTVLSQSRWDLWVLVCTRFV